jgi:hypothetical protein
MIARILSEVLSAGMMRVEVLDGRNGEEGGGFAESQMGWRPEISARD